MKSIVALMFLLPLSFALTWNTYVSLPVDEKILLQYERLNQLQNGSVINPDVSAPQVAALLPHCSEEVAILSSNPARYSVAMENVRAYLLNISRTIPTKIVRVGDYSVNICIATPEKCEHAGTATVVSTSFSSPNPNKNCPTVEEDWSVYCYMAYTSKDQVNCAAMSLDSKELIIHNMQQAQGCLGS